MQAVHLLLATVILSGPADSSYRHWPPNERESQRKFEDRLNRVPTPKSLRLYHEMIAKEPHVAGSPGDLRAADRLAAEFESLGLEVEKQELWLYLASPVDAAVSVVSPVKEDLALKEDVVEGDPYSAHPEASIGWNAYSGSGDVTSGIVYANYGTVRDFKKLRALGVDVAGKIVIARYGGNFRGYKAKFAELAGAVGLIIYTDPADSGYGRGEMYPEGGYANPSMIQRGSIATLPYSGDPLTPGVPATKNAKRLDPNDVDLPRIPVQPISWRAAEKILSRMTGSPAPNDWQGGLKMSYRVTGGDDLRVRLMVKQERKLVRTFNVVGTLRGATFPEQKVIIGCHHDAWVFGAGDPLAGTMVLYEAAKSFAKLAKAGVRPARSIVFANWAAEEFGIMGSVEWIEAHEADLSANAVAYLNLDMAVMGPNFGSSASPSLKSVIADAARKVTPVPGHASLAESVFDAWVERDGDSMLPGHPRFGHLGGGSDHVGFYCHLAIPSASLSAGGAEGHSYHSVYDNLAWYRKVVGDDYEPAVMLTRVCNVVLARLANAAVLPIDPTRYGPDFEIYLSEVAASMAAVGIDVDFAPLARAVASYNDKAARVYGQVLDKLERGELTGAKLACVNEKLLRLEREWIVPSGLPGREWFRNLFAAPDEDSGYAAWMLPAMHYALKHRIPAAMQKAQFVHLRVFRALEGVLDEIEACLK
jgi:N-acetylated-alpha-linked acidic dipeptidase